MFAKLLLIILVMGATACALLAIRQQRIETAHESALLHQRLLDGEQVLWKLRSEIAVRCQPDQVRLAMAGLGGSWTPILIRAVESDTTQTHLASHTNAPAIDFDWGG